MGSFEMPAKMRSSGLLESSCGYLLQELKLIWDEIGQDQLERDKVLLELEQECLDVYRRKVDSANIARARLHQLLADSEAEFTHLLVSLGERSFPCRPEKMAGTLKEQLDSITPGLREMQLRREERVNQFRAVQMQIRKISAEIQGHSELNISPTDVVINESELSLKKLDEYRIELQRLHREKNDRLLKVEEYTNSVRNLAATMGMDPSEIIATVHPSLDDSSGQQSKNISDAILAGLNSAVVSLKEEKQKRLEKLHRLGKALTNLWNLMDSNFEDRLSFRHITNFISVPAADVWKPGSLALDMIHQAEAEVERLDHLKASKMKELFLKKQLELEEICKRSHMEIPSKSEMDNIMNLINSGEIDHADLLASMDEHISKAKEEASSRKEIMEKVEKWIVSCDEERWLEEYSRDENRYSVSRGAHKNLKRAERARITVNRIPALMDSLIAKTRTWETERKKVFLYDEVPLLEMLGEYNLAKREKEEEKQRQREKKKMQSQTVEPQNLFLSRPNTSTRRLSNKGLNISFMSTSPLNRRLSMGIRQLGSNSLCSGAENISFTNDANKVRVTKMRPPFIGRLPLRDDAASQVSAAFSCRLSP